MNATQPTTKNLDMLNYGLIAMSFFFFESAYIYNKTPSTSSASGNTVTTKSCL